MIDTRQTFLETKFLLRSITNDEQKELDELRKPFLKELEKSKKRYEKRKNKNLKYKENL